MTSLFRINLYELLNALNQSMFQTLIDWQFTPFIFLLDLYLCAISFRVFFFFLLLSVRNETLNVIPII